MIQERHPILISFDQKLHQLDNFPDSFDNLMELIDKHLNSDLPDVFKIYVLDSEGDRITISSQ